jgi:fused signal recognition particle receptor
VVVAAGDTHRAGAIEQLTEHADRLCLKVIAQRYGADPSAVGRDAVEHARKNHIDVVLVDTAGRMQTSKNLMDEMGKIVRVVKPDAKLFIGDALAGNDTINQAREFYQYTNFDGAILTKIDADAKGGAAISIAYITSRPIVYVGVGQGYDDIIPFESDRFIESLFGTAAEVKVEDLMSGPQIETTHEEPVAEIKPVESALAAAQEKAPSRPVIAAPSGMIPPKQQEMPERTAPEPPVKPAVRAPPPAEKSEKKKDILLPQEPKEMPQPEPVRKEPESPESVDQKPPVQEESKEKKGRFGGLFKKKTDEERKKEEEQKRKAEEERSRDEAERARLEEEEIKKKEKEKDEKKKRKEDKDTEEDKIVYLTDEDIEDLLK